MARPLRRKKFIDPRVQGTLVRRLIFHWMLFVIVTALTSFVLLVLSNPFQPLSYHIQNLTWTHGPLLVVILFMLPVFVIDTIKLSNRFTGPIYALRRAMRDVSEGQSPRKLKFRNNDFWHDLAEEYNAMLARLGVQTDPSEAISDDDQLVAVGDHSSTN
jgi:nitrogen fixation/metabolism regulation signal transduction histidine kinase